MYHVSSVWQVAGSSPVILAISISQASVAATVRRPAADWARPAVRADMTAVVTKRRTATAKSDSSRVRPRRVPFGVGPGVTLGVGM